MVAIRFDYGFCYQETNIVLQGEKSVDLLECSEYFLFIIR